MHKSVYLGLDAHTRTCVLAAMDSLRHLLCTVAVLRTHLAPGIQLDAESLNRVKQLPRTCHVDSGERSTYPKSNNFGIM